MSRYSLNSTLALFQSVLTDSDATSSSTSSSSAVNNSSNSLSVSPAIERQQQHYDNIRLSSSMSSSQLGNCFGATKRQPTSNHLLELQKEIKEEEDEIFADINSLINNRSGLYASLGETAPTDYDQQVNDNFADDELNCHHFDSNTSRQHLSSSYEDDASAAVRYKDAPRVADYGEDLVTRTAFAARPEQHLQPRHICSQQRFTTDDNDNQRRPYNRLDASVAPDGHDDDDDDDDNDEEFGEQRFHPRQISSSCNRVVQLQQQHYEHQEQRSINGDVEADLEICNDGTEDENNDAQNQDLLQQFQQQQLQNSQAMQQVTSNLPKPCVFFLEGNCRRSDCKYSHDLSSITCKYWIEGFCFKGELCPFLHSFTSGELPDSSLFDDDGVALSKKELTPKFTIESEADFPSLPLDAPPGITLGDCKQKIVDSNLLTKSIKNQILSSNPAVVFKSSKKKRKKG